MEREINGKKVISLKLKQETEITLEDRIRRMWNVLIIIGILCVSIIARFCTY